jgi:hypothetical protein
MAGRRPLIAQMRRRPPSPETATMPLILAFCCVLSGDQKLPERRPDLSPLAIDCLLTGWWLAMPDEPETGTNDPLRLLREAGSQTGRPRTAGQHGLAGQIPEYPRALRPRSRHRSLTGWRQNARLIWDGLFWVMTACPVSNHYLKRKPSSVETRWFMRGNCTCGR